jgi:hypothetical protein
LKERNGLIEPGLRAREARLFYCLGLVIFLSWVFWGGRVNTEAQGMNRISVKPGEEFTLHKDETAELKGTCLQVEIKRFFNQPCPPNVRCVWSGVGMEFEYQCNGQTQKGINLVKAFGYRTTVLTSDYETYATLKVTRDVE